MENITNKPWVVQAIRKALRLAANQTKDVLVVPDGHDYLSLKMSIPGTILARVIFAGFQEHYERSTFLVVLDGANRNSNRKIKFQYDWRTGAHKLFVSKKIVADFAKDQSDLLVEQFAEYLESYRKGLIRELQVYQALSGFRGALDTPVEIISANFSSRADDLNGTDIFLNLYSRRDNRTRRVGIDVTGKKYWSKGALAMLSGGPDGFVFDERKNVEMCDLLLIMPQDAIHFFQSLYAGGGIIKPYLKIK